MSFFISTTINAQDPSALLELEGAENGLLIPRTDTAAVNAAVAPATGLLIFQTLDSLFYYFNGARWVGIPSERSALLVDKDGDTRVEVEKNNDEDKIRFDIQGREMLRMENNSYGIGRFFSTDSNLIWGMGSGDSLRSGFGNTFLHRGAGRHTTSGTGNCFVGDSAGFYHRTGSHNIFLGSRAGKSDTAGFDNIYIGDRAGMNSINQFSFGNIFIGKGSGEANNGVANVFIGYGTGFTNQNGSQNVFLGWQAGMQHNAGVGNVLIGSRAGWESGGENNIVMGVNTGRINKGDHNLLLGSLAGYYNTGDDNIFLGNLAGYKNINGINNVFIGKNAGEDHTTGDNNIYLGTQAGMFDSMGVDNIFIGRNSGFFNKTGQYNIFAGESSGYRNSTGHDNLFLGSSSGGNNKTGDENIYIGKDAGVINEDGDNNIFIGKESGYQSRGSQNIFIGPLAGRNHKNGAFNVFIGGFAGIDQDGSHKLYIENFPNDSTAALIYGEFDNDILRINGDLGINIQPTHPIELLSGAHVTAAGVWTDASDISFKKDIRPSSYGIQTLMQLNPVTWQYKINDSKGVGFIAQEVESVLPEVVSGEEGRKGIAYGLLTAVLTGAVQEQQAQIEWLEEKLENEKENNAALLTRIEKMERAVAKLVE